MSPTSPTVSLHDIVVLHFILLTFGVSSYPCVADSERMMDVNDGMVDNEWLSQNASNPGSVPNSNKGSRFDALKIHDQIMLDVRKHTVLL